MVASQDHGVSKRVRPETRREHDMKDQANERQGCKGRRQVTAAKIGEGPVATWAPGQERRGREEVCRKAVRDDGGDELRRTARLRHPIGTAGHSGRFLAEDYFYILDGEQWAYAQGELDRQVFRPGDCHVLRRGAAEGYRMPDRCYALEYARGLIPAMLPWRRGRTPSPPPIDRD